MSRYVHVVDAEKKSEVILFYMEPLERTGYKAGDFITGSQGEKVCYKLSAELTHRSTKYSAK